MKKKQEMTANIQNYIQIAVCAHQLAHTGADEIKETKER